MIRYLAVADHSSFIALERDAEVRRYVNGPSTKTDDEFLDGLRNYEPMKSLLVMADATTDAFPGRCGLLPVRGTNETELFLLLTKSNQRKGIGQAALQFLISLARCEGKEPIGIVHPDNLASRALMEKVGMVHVGAVPAAGYQNGHLRYVPGVSGK